MSVEILDPAQALRSATPLAPADLLERCGTAAHPQAKALYGAAGGLRFDQPGGEGPGYMDAIRVGERCLLTVHDRQFLRPGASTASLGGWISMHFRLTGTSTHRFGDREEMRRGARTCLLVAYPNDMLNGERFDAGERLRAAGLVFQPEFLTKDLGLEIDRLPPALARWLEGERDGLLRMSLPFTAAMHQAVSELVACDYAGMLRYRHAQAKALDLACAVGAALYDADVARPRIRLTSRERERIEAVRDRLSEDLADPLTIAELARWSGMNRTKLQSGFGLMFRMTIFDFRRQARLAHAHDLLREGDLSVGEIARAVGYDHANNFTAAFKRQFGYLPRDERGGVGQARSVGRSQ